MKVGCNTVVFAGVDLGTALEHVALAGYEHVELAAIRGMCEHANPDLGKDHASEVRGLLEGSGLTATAMEVASPDRERLEGIFWLAGELEIGIVNIGSGGE
ncbi:MAG TPA: hypothetical protein VFY57_09105, partial [Rubrobacteraceae bacterium]|nr:hypothetical protein [Rubrobacteraceae bacterium]